MFGVYYNNSGSILRMDKQDETLFCLKWRLRRKADTLSWWAPQHLQFLSVTGDQWQKQTGRSWREHGACFCHGGEPKDHGYSCLVVGTWHRTSKLQLSCHRLKVEFRKADTLISLPVKCMSTYWRGLLLILLKWMKIPVTQKMAFLARFVFNHGSWMYSWLENKNSTWQNKKWNYILAFVFDGIHWNRKKNNGRIPRIFLNVL